MSGSSGEHGEPIGPRRGQEDKRSPDSMMSRGLAFRRPKRENVRREMKRASGKASHMDPWWGADTDRACHRPQQFKSNLRHDRVSWILSCPTTSFGFSFPSATSRSRAYRDSRPPVPFTRGAECRSLQIDKGWKWISLSVRTRNRSVEEVASG